MKYIIRFTGKTKLFRRDFRTLNARTVRAVLSSNVHQFVKRSEMWGNAFF